MHTSDLQPGQRVKLVRYRQASTYSQQLIAVGLTPGTCVDVIRRAPLGDPIELQFRGINLALRQCESHDLEWALQ